MVSTNDISNLINAVEADPTDKTTRLALADAYEEQGNDGAAREQRTLANLTDEQRGQAIASRLGEEEADDEGHKTFSCGGGVYLVLTDEEANERAKQEILDSVWSFHAEFVAQHSRAPFSEGLVRSIRAAQDRCSDNCNDLLRASLDDEDSFVQEAIFADGRGHFLSQWDGEEVEVNWNGVTLYAYRIN